MNSNTLPSSAAGPPIQPSFETILMCMSVWERWFAQRAGRAELLSIIQALDRTIESQEAGKTRMVKAVAVECRTSIPNTCHAGPSRINLCTDDELERLDLSVIHHIRPSDRPLFNRQEIRSCQKIILVYPVRTIVDSDTESEGRSRPGKSRSCLTIILPQSLRWS